MKTAGFRSKLYWPVALKYYYGSRPLNRIDIAASLIRRMLQWTAAVLIGAVCLGSTASECGATLNIAFDFDARGRVADGHSPDATLNMFGAALRKTFADARGDRFVFFALFESEKGFNESRDESMHEMYGQIKGPMGAWNITVGRFGLPWGLLPDFSSTRLLYDMPHSRVVGMTVDSGVMISGVRGMLDYGVSYTRGYAQRTSVSAGSHGIAMGRIGITPGVTEEFSFGLSAAWGRSITAHGSGHGLIYERRSRDRRLRSHLRGDHGTAREPDRALLRAVVGLDSTLYWRRWLFRAEASAGQIEHRPISTFFMAADYALSPRLDFNLALNLGRHRSRDMNDYFVGLTGKLPWFILRGGYQYVGYKDSRNMVTVQVYRLFSFNF